MATARGPEGQCTCTAVAQHLWVPLSTTTQAWVRLVHPQHVTDPTSASSTVFLHFFRLTLFEITHNNSAQFLHPSSISWSHSLTHSLAPCLTPCLIHGHTRFPAWHWFLRRKPSLTAPSFEALGQQIPVVPAATQPNPTQHEFRREVTVEGRHWGGHGL